MNTQNRCMLQRSALAQKVAEWLYRAVQADEQASLREQSTVRQMPYHTAAEAAITQLLDAQDRKAS
jgi:hypothetical protein